MRHAALAGGSSADGLARPVVSAALGATTEAGVLLVLLVPVGLAGPPADGVALVVTFTLRLSSCTLNTCVGECGKSRTILVLQLKK